MKREATFLIAIALMVNSVPLSWAQDSELNDADLESLLDEKSSAPEVNEVPESTPSAGAVAPEATTETAASEPVTTTEPAPVEEASTDTVDIQDLEPLDEDKENKENAENAKTETADALPEETLEAPEKLEPLETAGSEKTADDLDTLKTDLGDDQEFKPSKSDSSDTAKTDSKTAPKEAEKKESAEPAVFDVGREERDLLAVAQNIQGQISDNEWNEVATAAKVDSYTVVKDEWLFKISKRIFGSGYFYPKIWSINSYITNPHFIEPGMVLSFTTGSGSNPPQV